MIELDRIYNEDFIKGVKSIPDESIDVVVTDCPDRICAGGMKLNPKGNEPTGVLNRRAYVSDGGSISNRWLKRDKDDIPCAVRQGKMFIHNDIDFDDWLPELYRVLKNDTHCYIMINSRNLCELQNKAEKIGFKYQNLLVWEKGNATPNGWYMQEFECVLFLKKGKSVQINDMGSKTILRFKNNVGKKNHPTEKPVAMMKHLISNSMFNGADTVVLDPFAGAGATLIAAKQLGCRYIGYEIDEKYYEIATMRMQFDYSRNEKQLNLF